MEYAFNKIIKHIKKLVDVDPQLRDQLRKYCHDIQGCCPFDFAQGKQEVSAI